MPCYDVDCYDGGENDWPIANWRDAAVPAGALLAETVRQLTSDDPDDEYGE